MIEPILGKIIAPGTKIDGSYKPLPFGNIREKTKMNLLLTLTSYPPSIGGAQLHMHQLACQLKDRHAIQVVTQWDSNRTDWLLGTTVRAPGESRSYQVDGVLVERIGLDRNSRLRMLPWALAYPLFQGKAVEMIARELSRKIAPWAEKADLVHNCRIGREGISVASFQLARQKNIPFVITPVHHPRWSGWLHRYYHQLYRQADAVIALTAAEKKILVSLGVKEETIFVTGNGPNLAENGEGRRFRTKYHLEEFPVILFLGQKFPYKGFSSVLEAADFVWKKIPEALFLFVGPRTPYSRQVFNRVTDRRVVEMDTIDLQEKTDALAACTLLCVPSSQESFGGVYTEAWSFAKPVIGCNIPAVAEVISDGEDGFLIRQDPEEIADRIMQLLSNPTLSQQMGAAGSRKVKERYTWEIIAKRTEEVYQKILVG